MKIKIPRSMRGKLKDMREPILEQMSNEQIYQRELLTKIRASRDEEEIARNRDLYDDSVEHWKVLKQSLEEYDKLSKSNWKLSPDTLLVVGGNLVGILLILNFEKMDIVRSKAISFVLKGRV